MDPTCAYAEELYDLPYLQIVQWLYLVMSVASVLLIFYTARCYLHRTIFENITKELIIALYAYISIFSAFMIIVQISHLFVRYTASTKCDAQVPKAWCVFRYTLTMIIPSFVILHLGITIQHALSTFLFGSREQKIAARVSIIASSVYPTILGIIAYSKDSLEGRIAYSSGITANSAGTLMFNLYLMLAMDIIIVVISVILWKYNQHKLAIEQSYDLSLSFHRRQNLYAMRQFLPISVVHAAVYGIFFISVCYTEAFQSVLSRGWYTVVSALANAIPWYCLLSPLMFLILIRRGHFMRASHIQNMVKPEKNLDEIYFSSLKEQWK